MKSQAPYSKNKNLRWLLSCLACLLLEGHSRCCVDREVYSMESARFWLR